ncbi:MAG TPA: hypothetical protein VHV77_04045 [Pirellulales bacterium]|jgi:hypothetical protein|nr:hypothetical protein [Pirellulales bacterium]
MTQKAVDTTQLVAGLSVLAEILDLIDTLRQLGDPTTSADALKEAIALVLQLATSFGLDQAWLDRISQVLNNQQLLAIAQAVLQYLASLSVQGREPSVQ